MNSKQEQWLEKNEVRKHETDADGTVNVKGSVGLIVANAPDDTLPVNFGTVDGLFDCSATNLITLKGCPDYVGKVFWGSCLKIKSLEGGPVEVGGDYSINGCTKLTSLKGLPTKVGGNLDLSNLREIKSLEDIKDVKEVNGTIELSGTPIEKDVLHLIGIEGVSKVTGLPEKVGELINKYITKVSKGKVRASVARADCAEELYAADFDEFAG